MKTFYRITMMVYYICVAAVCFCLSIKSLRSHDDEVSAIFYTLGMLCFIFINYNFNKLD